MEHVTWLRDEVAKVAHLADSLLVQMAGVFLVALLAWWFYSILVRIIEKKYHTSSLFKDNTYLFKLTKKAGHLLILIFAGMAIVRLASLPGLEKYFHAGIILLAAWFLNEVLKYLIPFLKKTVSTKTETKFDDVFLDLLARFSGVLLYATGIILALDTIGLNVMPFIAGAGVAGIAIGFAAKDTLSNLLAGVLLLIDRPFEIGDRIEVWSSPANSATWGDVIDIGLRATKIKTTDNIIIVIPNNEIMLRDIINYTAMTESIRVRIPIGVSYDTDIEKAKEAIIKTALEMDWALRDPAPKVVVRNFGESSVDLEARIWIGDARKRMDTISFVADNVKKAFDEAGIEIPYPKRDVYVKKMN